MSKKMSREKRIEDILMNIKTLKSDFESFRDWDTNDEDNWEAMIAVAEVIETQLSELF